MLARRGRVDAALLAELLQEPYLALPPPKTTGRELFGVQYAARVWDKGTARGLAPGGEGAVEAQAVHHHNAICAGVSRNCWRSTTDSCSARGGR